MTAQEHAGAAIAVRQHLDTLRHDERRLWRSRRRLRFALARTRWLLDVRDDAQRRTVVENVRLRRDLNVAGELIDRLAAMVAHPSADDDIDGLRANVAAHVGAYRRAMDERAFYHGKRND